MRGVKGGKEKGGKRKRDENAGGKNKKRSKRDDDKNGEVQNGTVAQDGSEEDDIESTYPGLKSYISIFEQGPLYPLDFDPDQQPLPDGAGGTVPIPHGPDGLRYHIMDIWLDELEKVLEFDEDESGRRVIKDSVPMGLLLRPIETLAVKGMHRPVRVRAKETLADERLAEWGVKQGTGEKEESESEDEWGGFGDD